MSLISAMSFPVIVRNVCVRLSPSSNHNGVEWFSQSWMRCSIVSACPQYSQSGFSLAPDLYALLFVHIVLFSIWNEVSLVFDGRLFSCIMLYALLKVSVVG